MDLRPARGRRHPAWIRWTLKIERWPFDFQGKTRPVIDRPQLMTRIKKALRRSRIVALIGPRQSGKTTLAREFVSSTTSNYFDLEDPVAIGRLDQPKSALEPLRKIVVIDEIQRKPELVPLLRVLADRPRTPARFLILGSASPSLARGASESLAGRVEIIDVAGFGLAEVGVANLDRHWCRGGFPRSFLARSDEDSLAWRSGFIRAFLEQDLPQLGVQVPSHALRRFWTMLAHFHGQVWNAADLARSMGVSEPTVRRYLDLLTDTFMVRQLQPWHENVAKRQVKAPKIYIRDVGLMHTLLGIGTHADLLSHPKAGASWEGYVIEEILQSVKPDSAYFWATHAGAEIDLLLFVDGKRYGVEIKRADAPKVTPSMRVAMADLGLEHIAVVYPGDVIFPLDERVTAVPVTEALIDRGVCLHGRRKTRVRDKG